MSKWPVLVCHFCMFKCQREFIAKLPHSAELEGNNFSKWVTFPTASPVVSPMGSLRPHGHCYNSLVTNYHHKLINTNAMEESSMSKPLRQQSHEACRKDTDSCKQLIISLVFCRDSLHQASPLFKRLERLIGRSTCAFLTIQLICKGFYKVKCVQISTPTMQFKTLSPPSHQSCNMLNQHNNCMPVKVKAWVGEQYTNLHKEQSPAVQHVFI